MSGFDINDNSNNKKIFGDFTKDNPFKAGGVRRENVDAKFQSIFDKVDTDNNGILDQKEIQEFISEVSGDDSRINKKEAKSFLSGSDGNKLTFQEGDKTKKLTPEDLREFLQQAQTSIEENDIKSAISSKVDGKAGVIIEKNDGSQEIIFNNKDLDVDRKTITKNDKGETVTTEYKGSEVVSQTIVGSNGQTEVITYENGKPLSKDVKNGINEQHYSYDANGNPVLETEIENKGISAKEKVSVHSYNGNTETIDITTSDGNKQTLVKVNGKLQSETNTVAGRQEIVVYGDDGESVTSKTILKGSDFSNPNSKEVITYNKDGTRTEVFEDLTKGYTQTDNYNKDGFKTKETAVVDGKTYTANYDGKGHGTLTLKAGETISAFAQRVGCSEAEIRQLNKFPGGIPQAGQQIVVPDKYVKATNFNNYGVNASAEKVKGNSAETKRVNQNLDKFSETYEQKGTKGKYASYDDYASRLIQNEIKQGTLPDTAASDKNLHKALTDKIKQLNGNKDIKTLDSIKCPVSADYKKTLDAHVARANKGVNTQNLAKNWKDGNKIANEVHNAIAGVGTDVTKLNSAFNKLNKDNVASVVLNYNSYSKNDNDGGICEALIDEWGLSSKNYLTQIYSNLATKATELNIDISPMKDAIKKGDKTEIDRATQAIATAITSRQEMSPQELKSLSRPNGANRQNASVAFAKTILNAENSLNAQRDYDGWAGDLADIIGHTYGSKNTESAVRKDISVLKQQQRELNALKNNPTAFANKFEEIFGTKYDPVAIENYGKIKAKWAEIEGAKVLADEFKGYNSSLLEYNGGEVKKGIYPTKDNMIDVHIRNLGKFTHESKHKMIQKLGIDWNASTPEQKMAALSNYAKQLQPFYQKNLNEKLGNKSYESWETQYNSAYNQAFGLKNDIMKRVEDYNHSQDTGAAIVKTTAKAGMMLTGVGAGMASTLVEGTDLLSSKTRRENFNGEAALDYANTVAVESLVGKAGKATGKYTQGIRSTARKYAANAASDISIGVAADFAKNGKVSIDGTLKNAIISAVSRYGVTKLNSKLGISANAKPDDPVTITIKGKTYTTTVEQIKNIENQASKPMKKAIGVEADNMVDIEV